MKREGKYSWLIWLLLTTFLKIIFLSLFFGADRVSIFANWDCKMLGILIGKPSAAVISGSAVTEQLLKTYLVHKTVLISAQNMQLKSAL